MNSLLTSQLYDEKTFYQTFLKDLERCQKEIVIESPYITTERMRTFDRVFEKLIKREEWMEIQSEDAVSWCEQVGVQVLLCIGNHHRKLALLDRRILWEGSLNILSQNKSREIMRRIENEVLTLQVFNFLRLDRFL